VSRQQEIVLGVGFGRGYDAALVRPEPLEFKKDREMTLNASKLPKAQLFLSLAVFLFLTHASSAYANVYATNIKVNGSLTGVSVPTGGSANISYILNEPASGGAMIRILSGNTIVRSISIPAGAAGTLRGTNTVVWNGTGDNSTPLGAGTYSVAITASAAGYARWTQITDDNADGNAVWEGRGIAVDQNTNSPYYGRVFVANAQANDPGANNWLGYQVGILKCNADASYADEGGTSTGGYPWAGDTYSPWHLEVSKSDHVYVDDFSTNGLVIAWDPTVSPGSQLAVLRPDNWTNLDESLSGPALFGSGTNLSLWMADTTGGLGILRYGLLPDGTCAAGDKGATAVAVGTSLTGNPYDVALDPEGNIYTILNIPSAGDPNYRVFRFPRYDPTNPFPITNADWALGTNDDTMAGANGIAVDPTGTYVAVAFTGLATGGNGCTQIFYATNGALVTNLDLGITISGFADHQDEDCAWDAVGNVYYIDNIFGVWRAVSPPGPNSSTTFSVATIVIGGTSSGGVQPRITDISQAAGVVTIDFTAGTNDTSANFAVQGAATVTGPYTGVAGASITTVAPGQFRATFPASGSVQYFRIMRQAGGVTPTAPSFNSINASQNPVVLTFTGNSTDSPSDFTILSAATVTGPFLLANATVTQLSPGHFQATVPASGTAQFYRVKR